MSIDLREIVVDSDRFLVVEKGQELNTDTYTQEVEILFVRAQKVTSASASASTVSSALTDTGLITPVPRTYTKIQETAIVTKGTKIKLGGLLGTVLVDTKWEKNSFGTNFDNFKWLSKEPWTDVTPPEFWAFYSTIADGSGWFQGYNELSSRKQIYMDPATNDPYGWATGFGNHAFTLFNASEGTLVPFWEGLDIKKIRISFMSLFFLPIQGNGLYALFTFKGIRYLFTFECTYIDTDSNSLVPYVLTSSPRIVYPVGSTLFDPSIYNKIDFNGDGLAIYCSDGDQNPGIVKIEIQI